MSLQTLYEPEVLKQGRKIRHLLHQGEDSVRQNVKQIV